jgi:hypothetical protein
MAFGTIFFRYIAVLCIYKGPVYGGSDCYGQNNHNDEAAPPLH